MPPWPARRHSAFDHSVKVWNGKLSVVNVRLDAEVAWLANEYPLARGQRVEPGADGSVTVAANVAGVVEAMRWVLSWGGSAEALEPPELREATRAPTLLEQERRAAEWRAAAAERELAELRAKLER